MLKDNEADISDEYFDELGDGNYGFVVDPTGELKSVFLPDFDETGPIPENVKKILELFGINDINGQRTLH